MNRKFLEHLDLYVYEKKLANGLKVYICPMDRSEMHTSLVVKLGSDVLDFNLNDKDFSVSSGTAHFLEHMMFAMEDGTDPLDYFSANGAYGNAYTNSKITRYYFTGYSCFFDNLRVLLDCVMKPYFTCEIMEKEREIITREINDGFDEVKRNIYYLTLKNLFENHPHKNPVFGDKNSIKKITLDDLKAVYQAFYKPYNMFMVITGDVDPSETISFIESYFKDVSLEIDKVNCKVYKEIDKVLKSKSILHHNYGNMFVTKAYKVKLLEGYGQFEHSVYISIYLDMLFSNITKFYDDVFNNQQIIGEVKYYTEIVDNYIVIYFNFECVDNYDMVLEIDRLLKSKKIMKEDFDLIIKDMLNNLIITSDKVFNMANLIINEYTEYGKFYSDLYEKYLNLDYDEFKKYIMELNFDNSTLSIID